MKKYCAVNVSRKELDKTIEKFRDTQGHTQQRKCKEETEEMEDELAEPAA